MYFCVVLCIFVLFYVFFVLFYVFLCCSIYFCVLFYVFLCCSVYFCVVLCIFCVVLCIFMLFYVFLCCSMYCCFVTYPVLFVCVCVLNDCYWMATQLQLNISYHSSTLSSTSALDVGWLSVPRPGSYNPGKTRDPLYKRQGVPQGRSGPARKISPPPGYDPRTAQPVANCYTNWAIPAHFENSSELFLFPDTWGNYWQHEWLSVFWPTMYAVDYILRKDVSWA
jgi:hypothetical protein